MIRKEGKARWTYTCKLCCKKWAKPDQFRAIERKQRHLRSIDHMSAGFVAALRPAEELLRNLGLAWGAAAKSLTAHSLAQDAFVLAPPPITPRRHSGNAEGA